MILITFATLAEADETLRQTDAKQIEPNLYTSAFGKFFGMILICGMGPEKTRASILQHIDKAEHFINFGIAGSLKEHAPQHTLFAIASVTDEKTGTRIELQKTGAHLLTVDTPLYDTQKRDALSLTHDLVDMEGFVIAQEAIKHKKRASLYKIVSDFCNEDTHETIKQKLPHHSKTLAAYVNQIMTEKQRSLVGWMKGTVNYASG